MPITTTNGMLIDVALTGVPPNGPDLVQKLGDAVDAFYGKNVANAAALPASGGFPGQRIWLVDVKGWAEWNGTAWVTDTAWVTPTLTNSWAAFDSVSTGFTQPAYRRKDGEVRSKGMVKSGTLGTAIFTFPNSTFWPAETWRFVVTAGAGTAGIDVSPTGVVSVAYYSTGAGNTAVDLSTIRFEPGT
jgi:hypothetical protein